jgi:ABC-type Fe3+ transport system permease subunit
VVRLPGRKTLGALIALPVVLPPLVGVVGVLFLYGESGFIARADPVSLGLEQEPPWRLAGTRGDPLVARVLDVRLLLSVHARGTRQADVSMLEARRRWGPTAARRSGASSSRCCGLRWSVRRSSRS